MKQKIFLICGIVFIMLAVASCNNITEKAPEENDLILPEGKALLVLNVVESGANARTIFPTYSGDITGLSYTLTGKKSDAMTTTEFLKNATYSDLVAANLVLDIGNWNFTLEARGAIRCSASLENFEIVTGKNSIVFELETLKSDNGGFNISLTFPGDVGVYSVRVELLDVGMKTVKYSHTYYPGINANSVTCSNTYVASGNYIISFRFFNIYDKELPPGYSELIQIRSGLTSEAQIVIQNLDQLHSIFYNLNGGNLTGNSLPASYNEQYGITLPTSSDIEKIGCIFGGWYDNTTFIGERIERIEAGSKTDVMLYAKWTPITYTITYEGLSDAEATTSNPTTYTVENSITLASPSTERTDVIFVNWTMNGSTVTSIPSGTTGNLVITAIWDTIKNFTVQESLDSSTGLSAYLAEQEGGKSIRIRITGSITSLELSSIATAIRTNSSKKVNLDLSQATGLTEIGNSTFQNCSNLSNITLPTGITTIGDQAFDGCSGLVDFVIPYGVITVGSYAFQSCTSLETITFPSTVTTVRNYAFLNCPKINRVNTTSIVSWQKITFGGDNFARSKIDSSNPLCYNGKLYTTSGDDISTSVYTYSISYSGVVSGVSNPNPSSYNSLTGLTLKELSSGSKIFAGWTLNGSKITSIPKYTIGNLTLTATWKEGAMFNAENAASELSTWLSGQSGQGPFKIIITGNLTSIYLTSIVTALKNNPAKYVSLDFEDATGLTTMPSSAFKDCTTLEGIVLPNDLTTIGSSAFSGCTRLTDITIPPSVATINSYAFNNCSALANVRISSIASWCGINFNSTSVIGDGSITPLYYAQHLYVNGVDTTDITIPASVKSLNKYTFRQFKGLRKITILGDVDIPEYGFAGCENLTTVVISGKTKTIGTGAFDDCTSLRDITIPPSVTTINSYAFNNCSALMNVRISSIASWCGINFNSTSVIGDGTISPLYYAQHLYVNGVDTTDIVIPSSVRVINSRVFAECKVNFTSLTISEGVSEILDNAFRNCKGFTTVTIPSTVTYIEPNVFTDCSDLTSVTFANTTGWGMYSSSTASSGTNIDVTNSVTNATNLKGSTWRSSYLRCK